MCNGDAQGMDDLCIIPMAFILSNFDLAAASLVSNRHERELVDLSGDKVLYTVFGE